MLAIESLRDAFAGAGKRAMAINGAMKRSDAMAKVALSRSKYAFTIFSVAIERWITRSRF